MLFNHIEKKFIGNIHSSRDGVKQDLCMLMLSCSVSVVTFKRLILEWCRWSHAGRRLYKQWVKCNPLPPSCGSGCTPGSKRIAFKHEETSNMHLRKAVECICSKDTVLLICEDFRMVTKGKVGATEIKRVCILSDPRFRSGSVDLDLSLLSLWPRQLSS